ncbi:arsenate reductase/protein-tyrosine-phosphatase family protein [Kordiimonas aquimaris]|uniref:arsenate reductase/protein-tyrosine-phosphatase family protein n=1 Tax=Kordiimonas aquimaris TaxID=707591 RepID=UPI0021CF1088|nr:hypothetical protein [Kordiimonas aquimaris]
MIKYISANFGTHRGLIRSIIDQVKLRLGYFNSATKLNSYNSKRLVFVCHGNICRSPFGEYAAKQYNWNIPITSIGLSTHTGSLANAVAIEIAEEFDIDMSAHRATDLEDFEVKPDDTFLVMEERHISSIKTRLKRDDIQVVLLGLWCDKPKPLIYDPYTHSRAYFRTCFHTIHQAVMNLHYELED